MLKDTQNPPLVQCCAKPGKVMPGIGGQEQASKLAVNID